MNNIIVTGLDGEVQQVTFKPGDSLMEVLRDAGYDEIMATCGGCCSCATCHVHIDQQSEFSLAPIEEDEEDLLTMADNYDVNASRLSCQINLDEAQAGMKIQIVETD